MSADEGTGSVEVWEVCNEVDESIVTTSLMSAHKSFLRAGVFSRLTRSTRLAWTCYRAQGKGQRDQNVAMHCNEID